MAKALMIQGTASDAGKSLITAGLCRIFSKKGYRVAPFKSQNMALNSYVTFDPLEMGRAQATQAFAARTEPDVRMNPILLKPMADNLSQVIVMGKSIGNMHFREYMAKKDEMISIVKDAYDSLAAEYDLIIIEGAGSPAEVNLRDYDFVNMKTAEMADAPVIIVGDIDRGGVFASLVGTMELLDQNERNRVKGFIINKFRGDPSFLDDGIKLLKEKTGKPTFGIVPMIRDLKIAEEDSVPLELRKNGNVTRPDKPLQIAVIALPHISNFTDFDAFQYESDVDLFYTRSANDLEAADMIILPGSKSVTSDLEYLEQTGLSDKIKELAANGRKIAGICGGYQMLGRQIADPESVESKNHFKKGLGLLDILTTLNREKILEQTHAIFTENGTSSSGILIKGYEIHHGRTASNEMPLFVKDSGESLGSINKRGNIWGTYIHGLFNNDGFRSYLLNQLRKGKGIELKNTITSHLPDLEFDRLSQTLSDSLNIQEICRLLGVSL